MVSASSLVLMTLLTAAPSVELWEFTAPWCGSCQTMEPIVQQLVDEGVPVRQIPFDDYQELARQANVTRLPSFVVVANGRILQRKVGVATAEDLRLLVQKSVRREPTIAPTSHDQTIIRGQQCEPECSHRHTPGPLERGVGRALSSLSGHESAPVHRDAQDTIQRALQATVRLRIEDPNGVSLGTGTIVDIHGDEALVVTCGHIFRDSRGTGTIFCDLQGTNAPQRIPGKLVSYDLRRDIGLVSLRTSHPVTPMRVGGPGNSPSVKDPVFSIGCNQGAAATVVEDRIIAVNRYHGPSNLVVGGRPIDGRSGGGLFSNDGILIGICNAADPEDDEGLYAALGPIHTELDAAGLSFIYQQSTDPDGKMAAESFNEGPALIGATESPQITTPTAPQFGSLEDRRATEVICIVRPKGSRQEDGKAYILDEPSPQLLKQLSKELSKRSPHQFTGSRQNRVR